MAWASRPNTPPASRSVRQTAPHPLLLHIAPEDHASIVVDLVDHPQVKADQRAVSRRRQFPVQGSEVLHRLRLPGQRLRLIQHLRPAEQPGEAQQGRAGGVLPEGASISLQGGEVLPSIRARIRSISPSSSSIRAATSRKKPAWPSSTWNREAPHTPQGVHCCGHHLQIRFHPGGSDQLHPALGGSRFPPLWAGPARYTVWS